MRHSAAGIACRDGRYFIAKRGPGSVISGLWEFPGGKVRSDETPQEALVREYREEFSVDISVGERIHTSRFTNGGTEYDLEAFRITLHNEPVLNEHTEYRWVSPESLRRYSFPESDRSIVEYLVE
jgi:8-oxo-dGTP diphosphatase